MKKVVSALLAGSLITCQAQAKDYSEDVKKMALFFSSTNCSEEYARVIAKYSPSFYTHDIKKKQTLKILDSKTLKLALEDEEEFKDMIKNCEMGKTSIRVRNLEFKDIVIRRERIKKGTAYMVFIKYKKMGGPDKTIAIKRIDFVFPDNMKKYVPKVVDYEGYHLWDIE